MEELLNHYSDVSAMPERTSTVLTLVLIVSVPVVILGLMAIYYGSIEGKILPFIVILGFFATCGVGIYRALTNDTIMHTDAETMHALEPETRDAVTADLRHTYQFESVELAPEDLQRLADTVHQDEKTAKKAPGHITVHISPETAVEWDVIYSTTHHRVVLLNPDPGTMSRTVTPESIRRTPTPTTSR